MKLWPEGMYQLLFHVNGDMTHAITFQKIKKFVVKH